MPISPIRTRLSLLYVCLLGCAIVLALPVRAQFSLGVGVHVGASSLNGFTYAHRGGRANLALGHPLGKQMAVELSAGYATFGNRRVQNGQYYPLPEYSYTVFLTRLHQADAALTLQYRPWRYMEFALGAGVGVNLRATAYTGVTYRDTADVHGFGKQVDLADQYYALDFALRPSAALLLNDHLALRLSCHFGLRNLSTLERRGWNAYTKAIFVGVDWRFLRPKD